MRSSYQRNLKTKESLLWFQESRNKWEQAKRRKVVALPPPLPPYSPSSAQRIIDDDEDEEDQVPPPPPQESTIEQLTSLTLNSHPKAQSSEEIARQAYRDRLIDFYEKHNPSKLDTVETTLDAFRGKEDKLFQKLEAKYLKTKSAIVGATPSLFLPASGTGPVCFLEFTWGESQMPKRVVIQLFYDKAPLACENFRCLCTGELGTGRMGKPLCYRYSKIHRVVPKFCVQGGDFTKGDGTGGESIYPPNSEHGDMWGKFRDETPFLQHSRKGLLSMANNGPNRNGSQFFFTLRPLSSLDGKHVVFGEILEGMDVIDAIGGLLTNEKQRPLEPVVISDCGEIKPNGQEIRASTGSSQPESEDRNKGGQNGFGSNTPFGSGPFSFGNAAAFSSTSFASSFGSLGGGAGFGATKNVDASIPNVAAAANTPGQLPAAGNVEIKVSGQEIKAISHGSKEGQYGFSCNQPLCNAPVLFGSESNAAAISSTLYSLLDGSSGISETENLCASITQVDGNSSTKSDFPAVPVDYSRNDNVGIPSPAFTTRVLIPSSALAVLSSGKLADSSRCQTFSSR